MQTETIVNLLLLNNFTKPTAIGITFTEAKYGVLNNVTCNGIGNSGTGDSIEINASTDIQLNNVAINSAGRYPILMGDNLTGTYNERISFCNLKTNSTNGGVSLALAYFKYCLFDNLYCDKGISNNSSVTGDSENTISNSTFDLAITGFFTYYNKISLKRVNFTNVYVNDWNGNVGIFSNPKTSLENYALAVANGATTTINFSTLLAFGQKGFSCGTLKVNSSLNSNQASYQKCEFLGSANLTDFNLSAITTVSTSIPRAIAITASAATGEIVLTNSTGVALSVNWTIDLSGAST